MLTTHVVCCRHIQRTPNAVQNRAVADQQQIPSPTQRILQTPPVPCQHRRAIVLSLPLAPLIAAAPPPAAAATPDLCNRVATRDTLRNPGGSNALLGEGLQLYYPRWMFGEWEVVNRFVDFTLPLGASYVDSSVVAEANAPAEQGGKGSVISYKTRFYSTLPDTWTNTFRVNVGQLPVDAIIADRAFNTRQLTNATLGFEAVRSVQYDSRDPGRQSVTFSELGPDMRPLPPFRVELFINAARTSVDVLKLEEKQQPVDSQFCTSELFRQVSLGVRAADVRDYEVITSYNLQKDGFVSARQRVVTYLQPQDPLYFQAANRAVSVYDYELSMTRVAPGAEAPAAARACVETPKDVVQCV